MTNPFLCNRCGGELESDDAIAIIEGVCGACRRDGVPPLALAEPPDAVPADLSNTGRSEISRLDQPEFQRTERPAAPDSDRPQVAVADTGRPQAQAPVTDTDRSPAPVTAEAEASGTTELVGRVPVAVPDRDDQPCPHPAHAGAGPSMDARSSDVADTERPREPARPPIPVIATPTLGARPSTRARRRARDLVVGTAVGLFLTGVVTTYVLTRPTGRPSAAVGQPPLAGSITLRVQPPWAVVKLDDRVLGPVDASGKLTLPLPADDDVTHWLDVSAEGYHSDRRPISAFGGVNEVVVELRARPYDVAIETDPPQADVWINDELKGRTPLSVSVRREKPASLTIRRRGFVPVSQELAPPRNGEPVELHFDLVAAGTTLHVECDPPGAEITVDGVVRGVAPLTIELDPSRLGQELAVAASAPGYESAATGVTLVDVGAGGVCTAQLTLARRLAEVEVRTVPPGGRVVIEGEDLGPTPVVARFEPTETGRTVVVSASLEGSYYGRRELVVPPAGASRNVTIPLSFNAQRVVFLLSFSATLRTDRVALTDRVVERIHRLTPQQRFAVLARTDAGVEAWPGGLGTTAATSEQKVRAYDTVRSLRPSAAAGVLEMLRSSLGFQPTAIWLFSAGDLDRDDLLQFSGWAKGRDVSVHVVRPAATVQDDWLREWTARHHGTFTVLHRPSSPALALDAEEGE